MTSKITKIVLPDYSWLWLSLALAFLIRCCFLRFEYAAGWDEINYLKLGASGAIYGFNHLLHPYWSPLYPFFISLSGKIFSDFELAGRMVSIFFGTVIIVPVYLFSAKNFGRRTAIINSLLLALFPALIESSVAAETEPLYMFLAVTGILVGFTILRQQSLFGAVIVGVLFALAYLTRPEGSGLYFVFSGIVVCLILVEIVKYRRMKFGLLLILVTLGFLITSAPYLIYLKKMTGQWTLSAKGAANLQGETSAMENAANSNGLNPWLMLSDDNTNLPDDDIYHTGEFLKKSAFANNRSDNKQVLTINPYLIVKKFLKNFLQVIKGGIAQVLGLPILILIVLGVWGRTWDKNRLLRESYLLTFVGFFWLIVVPMFHYTERYMLPLVPLVLIWSGAGVEYLMEWFEKTWGALVMHKATIVMNRVRIVFLVLFIGSLFAPAYVRVIARNPYEATEWAEPVEQKKAGLWLKAYCGNEVPIVMACSHAVSFYAGNYNIKQSITIPHNDLTRVLAYAKYRGAKFLALNEKNKASFPTISYLLDEKLAPSQLKLIYKDDSIPGLKATIYEIVADDEDNFGRNHKQWE